MQAMRSCVVQGIKYKWAGDAGWKHLLSIFCFTGNEMVGVFALNWVRGIAKNVFLPKLKNVRETSR